MSYVVFRALAERWTVVFWVLAVAGCASYPVPDLSGLPPAPAGFPIAALADPARGSLVFRVTDAVLRVRVGREGSMARLGHSHVLTAPIHGLFSTSGGRVIADLYVPVAAIIVDDPRERARSGSEYASVISVQDRQGTRGNLLSERVLDAANHGFIRARIDDRQDAQGWVTVMLELAGRPAESKLQVITEQSGRCEQKYRGAFNLTHAQFGLQPFAALGGALRVSEMIEVDFELTARPADC